MPMLDPIIVALTGPAEAGKDTVGDYLVEHHGFAKLAFADTIRDEVGRAFDVSIQLLTQRETKDHPMTALALGRCMDAAFVHRVWSRPGRRGDDDLRTPRSPRQITQWWGTEYRCADDPYYVVDALTTRFVKAHSEGQQRFVVTDVRKGIEADLLRELGARLWQITRPGFDPKTGAHSTETTGAEFNPDHQLVNNHSITHLHKQAYALVAKLCKAQEAA